MNNQITQNSELQYKKIIDQFPSVQFYRIGKPPEWFKGVAFGQNDSIRRIAQVDVSKFSKEQAVEWVIEALKKHNIAGQYWFSFSGSVFGLVDLGDTYEWVEPLWFPSWEPRLSAAFYFISPDHEYLLYIKWSEHCMSNKCYEIWTAKKPST